MKFESCAGRGVRHGDTGGRNDGHGRPWGENMSMSVAQEGMHELLPAMADWFVQAVPDYCINSQEVKQAKSKEQKVTRLSELAAPPRFVYSETTPGEVVQWEDGAFAMRRWGFDSPPLHWVSNPAGFRK